jgi:hypothetical protein
MGSASATPKAPGASAAGGMPKPAGGLPKAPKVPGMGKPAAGGMPKPAGVPKTPAMGAGQPALKTELNKAVIPSVRDKASQAAKLPGVRASVSNTMDNMLAGGSKPLNPGQPLAIKPIISNPLAPVGARPSATGGLAPAPKAAPVGQTMVERVAAKMPAGPAAGLTPPPAAARPGASLPGAHLFGAKPSAPKVK